MFDNQRSRISHFISLLEKSSESEKRMLELVKSQEFQIECLREVVAQQAATIERQNDGEEELIQKLQQGWTNLLGTWRNRGNKKT